jgi:16S rRNA (adenine1518-N6/adenine1519-N6)-dimethyltransferase
MSDARAVLRRAGLAPKRSFGQNFLVSPHAVASIAEACVPERDMGRARVLELGGGTGVLSRALALRAGHVTVVERDRDLVPVLTSELGDAIARGACTVLEGDAQTVDIAEILGEPDEARPRVLGGNLPYQITGRLLERAVQNAEHVDRVVFMVQLEVAERLAATPGDKTYGALTVFVNAAFRVKKLFNVSPGSFHPPPDVTSAVVMLEPERPRRAEETDTFRAVVKGAFGTRRKTLRNAWRGLGPNELVARAAEAAGISLDARGETLSVDAFARMARELETAAAR